MIDPIDKSRKSFKMNLRNNFKLMNDEVTKFNRLMPSEMQRNISREAKEILGKADNRVNCLVKPHVFITLRDLKTNFLKKLDWEVDVKIQFGEISKMLLGNVCLLLLSSGRILKPVLTGSFESRIGIIGFLANLALRISTPLLGWRFLIESLIFPRNTPNYRQADKNHQAFLQVNFISQKICMETAG